VWEIQISTLLFQFLHGKGEFLHGISHSSAGKDFSCISFALAIEKS